MDLPFYSNNDGSIRNAIHSSISLLGNASAHFNVERRKAIMKHLNADIKHLAEAEFPDRGQYLFGEDFGKRAKAAAEDVRALKGIQSKKSNHFSGSGGSNRSMPQSRRQKWGITSWPQKSVFNRLYRPAQSFSRYPNKKSFKPPKQAYEFTCLPFGLAAAPRVFAKVMKPVVGFIRSKGVWCVVYINDFLLMHQKKQDLIEQTVLTLNLLEALGFLVNYSKSRLQPSQRIEYLGFMINSVSHRRRWFRSDQRQFT